MSYVARELPLAPDKPLDHPRPLDHSGTLLVIDDDRRIVDLVTLFLEGRGFQVAKAYDFTVARSVLEQQDVRLVLSDIHLGREDGARELVGLAAEGILPPTLVISGHLDEDAAARLRGMSQVRGVLTKPFQLKELEERIQRALEAPENGP